MSHDLDAATVALAGIEGFSDGERRAILGFLRIDRTRVGPAGGLATPLTSLVDRAFTWSEFDRWHAFFSARDAFPRRWDGLQVIPAPRASPIARRTYRQRKLELLLEWLDMLTRRAAELDHYTRRGRRVRIVRQEDSDRCPVCESVDVHEVTHGGDTLPPLHPGCRCVLMAGMTVRAANGSGRASKTARVLSS